MSLRNSSSWLDSVLAWIRRSGDSLLSSWIDPGGLVLRQWIGGAFQSQIYFPAPRLCLFSHFDLNDQIQPYVVHYVESLYRMGMHVVFISTAEGLTDQEVDKVLPYCTKVIKRKNIGLDFGSWRIGLLKSQSLNFYSELVLANDSVFGPLFPLEEVFGKMQDRGLDFWGITSNRELQHHLQSYFLVFGPKAFQSRGFIRFWRTFRYFRSKHRIILEYELGLSELAKREFWEMGAYIDEAELNDLNPTLYRWDQLIEKHRCPFLKTEVLRLNRVGSPRVAEWKRLLEEKTNYDTSLITHYLNYIANPE